ncbi:MAG: Gfo/Idh/MocA family oxidoreductase [Candidatus Latescibacteria bacterium]|nr:Gfo/Idh/MocA family oxidoreductase [Candidatus Latescibacterota bacterium]
MSRIRIGVVGCGAIAQIQHIPHIMELRDQYELVALCDVSQKLVEFMGDMYQVPNRYTDYEDLLASDVEAVLLCFMDPKTEVAVAALNAGKHVFIEKPMCYSLEEADRILEAERKSGATLMVGYMKQHDPGYQYAKRQVDKIPDIRFIQVNHLHPNNDLHTKEFTLYRFDDVPASAVAHSQKLRAQALHDAIGDQPDHVNHTFFMLSGSMIHDISSLRGMFGPPESVISAEIWRDGRCFTSVLSYEGDKRCVVTWTDLPELWDFRETLEVYGGSDRVSISFPTGFARGEPSPVTVQGMEEGTMPWKKELIVNTQNSFKLELVHFHDCITQQKTPLTDATGARDDIKLVRDIIRRHVVDSNTK